MSVDNNILRHISSKQGTLGTQAKTLHYERTPSCNAIALLQELFIYDVRIALKSKKEECYLMPQLPTKLASEKQENKNKTIIDMGNRFETIKGQSRWLMGRGNGGGDICNMLFICKCRRHFCPTENVNATYRATQGTSVARM